MIKIRRKMLLCEFLSMSKDDVLQLVLNQEEVVIASVEYQNDHALEVVKKTLMPPPMFSVVILNDDFTPMDFVVEVLQKFFFMSLESATKVMLIVHTLGQAVCGVFSKDVAETKAMQVNRYARDNQQPLLAQTQQVDG